MCCKDCAYLELHSKFSQSDVSMGDYVWNDRTVEDLLYAENGRGRECGGDDKNSKFHTKNDPVECADLMPWKLLYV